MDINSPFTMVVLIVAIAVGADLLNNWIKAKKSGAMNENQSRQIDALQSEVKDLKDRVRVLEKLAVDEDRRLKTEIDRLG